MSATKPGQVIEKFIEYFNAGDLDGLVHDLYEDGAVLTAIPGAAAASGKAAIREAIQAFIALGGKMTLVQGAIFENGDIALTHNRWRIDVPGRDALGGSTAEVVRRQADGSWKYVIDNPWGSAWLDTPPQA